MNFNGDTQVDTAAQPNVLQIYEDMGQEEITTGPPPMTLHVGNRRTQCHLMKSPRPKCCLRWSEDCEHCTYKNAKDERWKKQLIILAAENACAGIYNFIVPLRSHFISMNSLSPIILLLEADLDDLLLAGINKVSHLVIANNESPMDNMEETMTDSRTIVATQTILRVKPGFKYPIYAFPSKYRIYTTSKLRERMTSSMSHIFRLPFAAGRVFSASMLDTLLYQTFVKGYLITFVRLLLGIDAEENSGHLSSVVATEENLDEVSYVILNPTPKRKLRVGDYIYVIQPSSMSAIPSKYGWNKNYQQRLSIRNKKIPERFQDPQVNGKNVPIPNKDNNSSAQSLKSKKSQESSENLMDHEPSPKIRRTSRFTVSPSIENVDAKVESDS
ncbi:hypothetical protein KUTeg_000653 [Tegillarca granosa]|uniref:Uncharacterized protein n=1 Tax=Tegillarca granosa TaxID=220873 RepID=A0ABQ9G1K2_TEGGR|nr:hypothetical protein KUTeg_000653 [Tegillarca granosa]